MASIGITALYLGVRASYMTLSCISCNHSFKSIGCFLNKCTRLGGYERHVTITVGFINIDDIRRIGIALTFLSKEIKLGYNTIISTFVVCFIFGITIIFKRTIGYLTHAELTLSTNGVGMHALISNA